MEAKPFLKWAGGKSKLAPLLLATFPSKFGTYVEPFLGGGAIFFKLRPKKALLADINPELINAYRALQLDPEAVISELQQYRDIPLDAATYYQIRALDPLKLSLAAQAARLIFLNRTCYNGLYRVNSDGKFNVPFGRHKNPQICNVDNLLRVAKSLKKAILKHADVFTLEKLIKPYDLVYLDPPYVPLSKTANFTAYTEKGFKAEQQIALAELFSRLAKRQVYVVLSNSDTPLIRKLYKKFKIKQVLVKRLIGQDGQKRHDVAEVIVTSF